MNIRDQLLNYGWKEQKSRLLPGIIMSLAASAVLLLMPWLFKIAVSGLPRRSWFFLIGIGLAIITVQLLASGLNLGARWLILNATKETIRRLRNDLIRTLLFTSRNRYSGLDRAFVHSRIIDDTERLDVMLNAIALNLLPTGITSLILLLFLFQISTTLTLLLLTTIPLFIFFTRRFRKLLKRYAREFNDNFEKFSRGIRFLLEMHELTLYQNTREEEFSRQLENTRRLQGSSQLMALMSSLYALSQDFVIILATVIVLLGGGYAVRRGQFPLADLASFYIAVLIIKGQLRTFSSALPQCIVGWESLRRLEELKILKEEKFYLGKRKIVFQGHIEGQDLSFAYPGKKLLFSGLSFSIPPGSITALAGPNGSGKTTLLNLICGIYHPQSGRLFADGIPYSDLDIDHLRGQLAMVSQSPLFFDGSIRENLVYGLDREVDDKQLYKLLDWVSATGWIKELNKQLDTEIGENGIKLSGGQRQGLAITRALLRRPALILLDEPTNHLDADSITRLLEKLDQEKRTVSIVLVTHDHHVLAHCDRIINLEKTDQ